MKKDEGIIEKQEIRLLNYPPLHQIAGKTKKVKKDRLEQIIWHGEQFDFREMKSEMLYQVGFRFINIGETKVKYIYVVWDDNLKVVPFCYMRHGSVLYGGINLLEFVNNMKEKDAKEIQYVVSREYHIKDNKVQGYVKLVHYDCKKFDFPQRIYSEINSCEKYQKASLHISILEAHQNTFLENWKKQNRLAG